MNKCTTFLFCILAARMHICSPSFLLCTTITLTNNSMLWLIIMYSLWACSSYNLAKCLYMYKESKVLVGCSLHATCVITC